MMLEAWKRALNRIAARQREGKIGWILLLLGVPLPVLLLLYVLRGCT